MASTTSDTGDTSSKQQQAQRKENYNKRKRPFHQSITAILTEEKREEKRFTKPTHVAVYLFRDLCVCVCVCERERERERKTEREKEKERERERGGGGGEKES